MLNGPKLVLNLNSYDGSWPYAVSLHKESYLNETYHEKSYNDWVSDLAIDYATSQTCACQSTSVTIPALQLSLTL